MKHAAFLFGVAFALSVGSANAQQSQYSVVEKLAHQLLQKYQNSTCEQLAVERQATPSGQQAQVKSRAGELLRQDPKMRAAFLRRVALPIADKMVQCGFIP